MPDHDWSRLFSALRVSPSLPTTPTKAGAIFAVPKPLDASLDDYEARSGFLLPRPYREFVKVFGPGEFSNGLRLRVPGYRLSGKGQDARIFNEQVDLEEFNKALRGGDSTQGVGWVNPRFKEPQRLARLVYFASDWCPDYFGWDPEDPCDPKSHERSVYVLEREEEVGARFAAASFGQFVQERIVQRLEGLETREFCEALFSPYSRHKADAPWLENATVLWRQ